MSPYYRFRPVIVALVRFTSILPRPILRFLYGAIQPFGSLPVVLLRYMILRNICQAVGDNVFVGRNVEIRFPERLSIGSNVSINRECYIDAMGTIRIGSDVSIAHQCSLIAFDHGCGDSSLPIRRNPLEPAPIDIAGDVWIGAGVRILAGARVASRCIVAAGSVVTRRTPAERGQLIAGIPAAPRKPLAIAEEG